MHFNRFGRGCFFFSTFFVYIFPCYLCIARERGGKQNFQSRKKRQKNFSSKKKRNEFEIGGGNIRVFVR